MSCLPVLPVLPYSKVILWASFSSNQRDWAPSHSSAPSLLPLCPSAPSCLSRHWFPPVLFSSSLSCCLRRRQSNVQTCAWGSWGTAAAASAPSGPTPVPPCTSSWGRTSRLGTWVLLLLSGLLQITGLGLLPLGTVPHRTGGHPGSRPRDCPGIDSTKDNRIPGFRLDQTKSNCLGSRVFY